MNELEDDRSRPCTSVGPYYPVGEIEWMCREHDRIDLDRDPRFAGQDPDAGGWSCPVSGQDVQVPSARALFKREQKKRHKENARRRAAKLAALRAT